jgi:large subunit ribosomal protein L5e
MKILKTSSYFSRFQVKYKRRRQGKTDYRARLRLTTQDKNKYNTPKYRMTVRFSNKDITCQIQYATIAGDIVVASAYAHELPAFGLKQGLTNYAAAYCTGLLLARRTLTKFSLADTYQGLEDPDAVGEDYNVDEADEGPRPFTALLDTGLKRTSTGSKVFAALKGALDGGLNIPHSEKRFVGYSREDKSLDAETLAKFIYGGHVADYMNEMQEEDPEKYQVHFAKYVENDLDGDGLEDMYKEVHAAIRANPVQEKKQRSKPSETQKWKPAKLTYDERKANLKAKLAALQEAGGDAKPADDDDEEEEEEDDE